MDLHVKQKWELIAGPVIDYSDQVSLSWQVNTAMDKSDFGIYLVHKADILTCDFTGIRDVIDRLSRNKEALLKNRGTLEVLIAGFDDDPKEAYEISEIRHWYSESIRAGIPWFYFLGKHCNGMGLIVLLFAYCDIEIKYKENENTCVEITDVEKYYQWLEINYNNLNQFVDENNISDEINKEMSQQAYAIVSGNFVDTMD